MNDKSINIFTDQEVKDYINNKLDGWSYDGKWIRKTFKTHSWKSTLMVVNSIGHLAEAAWHHPDLQISYAFVEVKLMNHAKKGITQLDFDLAKKIDDFILWNPKNDESSLEGTPSDQGLLTLNMKKMMNEIDQLFTFGEIINPCKIKDFNLDASPLIKGKRASLDEAIRLIKKKVKKKEVHFSNISCDIKTMDKVIEIAEKKRFSINHLNQNEINNFYLPFQKFEGSVVSLNELKIEQFINYFWRY